MIAIPFCCVRGGDGSNTRLLPHCYILIIKAFHGVEQDRGAVLLVPKSRGAVWCRLYFRGIVRCGTVQFSLLHFMRCAALRCSLFSLRFAGADFAFQESHSAMRYGAGRGGEVRLSVQQLFLSVRLSVPVVEKPV